MKLTSQVIFGKLRERYVCTLYEAKPELLLRAPLLYDGKKAAAGYAYIMPLGQLHALPADTQDVLVICPGGEMPHGNYNVIVLEKWVSEAELLKAVTDIFLFFQQWDDSLNEVPNDRDGIRQMLDLSTGIFGGYLLLVDAYYNYAAVSANTLKQTPYFDPVDLSRPSQPMLKGLVEDPVIYQIMDHKGAMLYQGNGSEGGKDCLFVNLFREGESGFYYRLLFVRDDGCYASWYGYLLEHLAARIHRISSGLSLFSSAGQIHLNLKNLLKNTLESAEQNPSVISTTLKTVSWAAEDRFQAYVFYPFLKGQSPGSNSYIMNRLELLFPGSCALLLDDTIVMLRNITRSSQRPDRVRDVLAVFLKDNLYKVGISSATERFEQIPSAYVQAKAAYQLGSARHPHYWYYNFGDYVMDYVILKSTADMPAVMLCQNTFLKLREYDGENDTQYLQTLRVYIQEKFNATHAAASLYIHRTTFLDRLERIKKITSLDLDNWDTVLHLMLSYRMTEIGSTMPI